MNGLKKLIADNIKETKELREVISKDGAEKIRKYDELMKALDTLTGILSINTVKSYDDLGNPTITVTYKSNITPQTIYINEENDLKVSEAFRAINLLNLISYKDMRRLNNEIENAKRSVVNNKMLN
jgi:hypothetical protein